MNSKAVTTENMRVYLSGGMSGVSYARAVSWRNQLAKLQIPNVELLSPLRNKTISRKNFVFPKNSKSIKLGNTQWCPEAITQRDYLDVSTSHVVVVDLRAASRVSIGTMIELGWATAMQKPILFLLRPTNSAKAKKLDEQATNTQMAELPKIYRHPFIYRIIDASEAYFSIDDLANRIAEMADLYQQLTTGSLNKAI